ncbi:MAG: TonB-dependent receptor [Pseudomonas sp.]
MAVIAVLACNGQANAQQSGTTRRTQDEARLLDTVTVTGSRGVQRTVIDSPSPIDVVSSVELERTGKPDVISALNVLVPSFDAPAKGGNGSTYVYQTGGLRGLNVDQTLILINGKRRHRSAHINARGFLNAGSVPADLNLIPVSAVERIEVLRDGAAAQYGSDAIAGVINVILKSDGSGGRVNLQYGENFDRGDGEITKIDGHKGFTLQGGGTIDVFFDARDQKASTRAERISDSYVLYPLVNGQPDPREATINRLVEPNYGNNPQTARNFGYNAVIPVSDGLEFYSFATYGRRDSTLVWNFRQPNNVNSLIEIYPNGFNPEVLLKEQDYELATGLRGTWGEWDWDLATTFGRNKISNYGRNTINASLGPSSPTSFYYGALQSTDWASTIDLTRRYDWAGRKLQVSWGAEYRYERYQIFAGEPLSYAAGDYVIPEGQPLAGQRPAPGAQGQITYQASEASDLDRNSGAAYVDVGLDVTDRWFVGLAGRYEHFDDAAGNTTVGKLTTRYAFTPALALRGTVSTGFRAPALAQWKYASTTSTWRTVDGEQVLNLVKYLPVDSAAAIALGAKPLTPEESTSYSLGFTYSPLDTLSLTLDAYRIEVDDRISLTGQISGDAVQAILAEHGIVGELDSAQYFTNALDTVTQGVDLVASYRLDLDDWGQLALSLGSNYNKTKIVHVDPTPSELAALGDTYTLFNRANQGLASRSPRTKTHIGANWRKGPWAVTTQFSRWGTYTNVAADEISDVRIRGKWITNLDVAYALTGNITLSAGANNLFNVYPDRIAEPSANRGSQHYPTGTGYGFTGGSWYTRLSVGF